MYLVDRTTASYRIPAEGPEQFPAALEGKGQEEGGWDETTKALRSCHEKLWKNVLKQQHNQWFDRLFYYPKHACCFKQQNSIVVVEYALILHYLAMKELNLHSLKRTKNVDVTDNNDGWFQ